MSANREPRRPYAWLQRHKILFETVAVAVFTLASLFVAYLQWRTAKAQTQIALRQGQPNFVMTVRQIWNEAEAKFTEDELQIRNFGGAARELRHHITTFLHVTTLAKGDPRPNKIDLPLSGYYNTSVITNDAVTGLLVKAKGDKNDQRVMTLTEQVRDLAAAEGYICLIELVCYVRLTYRDLFDEFHIEYFSLEPVIGARTIPVKDGERLIELFDEAYLSRGPLQLYKTNAGEIWDQVKKQLPVVAQPNVKH